MTAHKPITDDDLYRHSSQYRLWSFSREQLAAKKQHAYDRAVVSLQTKSAASEKNDDDKYLSIEEHEKLVNFYASKVSDIAKTFRMPSQVRATAIAYFKRFFLQTNVMEHHPKNVLYTAIFLASKAENHFITIEKFCEPLPRTEPKDILDLEFLVLQTLSFTLSVQNPLSPLHGFFLDMVPDSKSYEQSGNGGRSLGSIYDDARRVIMDSLLTDAMFLYTPPQIALAALYHADKQCVIKYLEKKFGGSSNSRFEHLLKLVQSCHEVLIKLDIPSSDLGKSIDKKLHLLLKQDKKKKRSSPEQEKEKEKEKELELESESGVETKKIKLESN